MQDALRLEIPTREEMQEIESSSRLYREGDALFLTAQLPLRRRHRRIRLHRHHLRADQQPRWSRCATPRPRPSPCSALRAQRTPRTLLASPDAVMLHLFEQVVDRLADILERVGADMDRASQRTFRTARGQRQGRPRKDDRAEGRR